MIKNIIGYFKRKDELIGIWTKEDDGSGLLNLFGWSLHFLENGIGKSYYWESELETIYDFEWQRLDKNSIKLRRNNKDWEIISYKIEKYIGTYKSKRYKLTELGKNSFLNSPEPLFKRRYF